ncbi:hypothetical protein Leryth_007476 [Lithospermum erythrorhizon]|nr:hypothetical protein Leryth_007476 [Lithospermum erythrorhizon]
MNALEVAGAQPSESEVAYEVAMMSQTNMYRPGIDVTQAELNPLMNWRQQKRTEMVGPWKANVYDMHNVMFSVKSRRVPGAITDKELFSANDDERTANGFEHDDLLTAEERKQLDSALRSGNGEDQKSGVQGSHENFNLTSPERQKSDGVTKEKKGWLGWSKKGAKHKADSSDDAKTVKKFSKLAPEDNKQSNNGTQKISSKLPKGDTGDLKKNKDKNSKKKMKGATGEPKNESEFKKGLRPVLWLTPDFPLKVEELLPLLDILANKVKAVRRLRELLTTTLPSGTFPVKIAIPIVPTVRVMVTFTKFEELQEIDDEFSTPPSSPTQFQDVKSKESKGSTSWVSWMRGNRGRQSSDSGDRSFQDEDDPFHIPSDYVWVDANEKLERLKAKRKQTNPGPPGTLETGHRVSENTDV